MTVRINTFSAYLKRHFGYRVHKVSLDAGFTCPNRDGTRGTLGCTYCDARAFHPRPGPRPPIAEQLREGIERLRRRRGVHRVMAYFQPYSNTYADVETLRKAYDTVLDCPPVVAMAIGTRPDCVDEQRLDLIQSYASRMLVWLEYGLQSCHDETLRKIGRGHTVADFERAVLRTAARQIRICAHIIIGLPGEGPDHVLETARFVASLPIDGVKLHNLHVVEGTVLEQQYRSGAYRPITEQEYVRSVCDFLERIPATMVVQRLAADVPHRMLVAPQWAADKRQVLRAIREELKQRDGRQGRLHSPP